MKARLYKPTLYEQLREIESIDEELRGIDSSSKIDVLELQRNLFRKYEENPVLYDVIKGKQTIGKSLEELSQINRGIRKILPWRKNKGHNERLKQLGELVSEPYHLHTDGIFCPDNIITIGVETPPMVFGFFYLLSLLALYINTPEEFQQKSYILRVFMPAATSVILTVGRVLGTNERFNSSLPKDEAKYLDEKVIEFYK